jgi:hypothetical protein
MVSVVLAVTVALPMTPILLGLRIGISLILAVLLVVDGIEIGIIIRKSE